VSIMDILENEVLLFHFMEFLENSEGRNFSSLLEFWISANNFRQQGSTIQDDNQQNDNLEFLRNDAIAIYDKFISLQASSPLGFSSSIR
jgi:A-kinase anchor protein 10